MARVQEDPAFADRLYALHEDPAALQELIVAEGFDVTPDEVREAFLEAFGSELSEEQLAAISGGYNEGTFVVVGSMVGGSAVVAGALTAAAAT